VFLACPIEKKKKEKKKRKKKKKHQHLGWEKVGKRDGETRFLFLRLEEYQRRSDELQYGEEYGGDSRIFLFWLFSYQKKV